MIQPIWYQIREADPDLFFWLGDNIYGDTLHSQFLAELYRRQRNVASLQPVLRNIPNLAIWDDHDYALNDGDRENPIREESLRVFKNYWATPPTVCPMLPAFSTVTSMAAWISSSSMGVTIVIPHPCPTVPAKPFLGSSS